VIVAMLGVVAAFILLDKRENTYCVPLERSASVVGGVIATYVLSHLRGYPVPTRAELIGVALLVAAIVVLSVGPRLGRDRTAERLEQELREG
jgi:peptidoglycan/LPS O-acetylase OafA/YrhL